MAIQKKSASQAAAQQQDEAPAKTAGKKVARGSFADMVDSTKAGGGFPAFPDGKWQARVTAFKFSEHALDAEDEPLYARITFTGEDNDNDEVDDKEMRQQYTLRDKQGQPSGGIGFLKGDLVKFGYEDAPFSDWEEIFTQIANDKPLCALTVKTKGGHSNAFIDGIVVE